MPLPLLIPIAMTLAKQFLPSLIGKLAGDDAEKVAEKIVGHAKEVTGKDDPQAALESLQANPELLLQYKEKLIDLQVAELEEDTKRLKAVNETMQEEAKSTDSFVRRWRPFYGYCVATSWFIQMTLFSIALAYTIMNNPTQLPAVITALAGIFTALAGLWGIALAVLGISVHQRSKDKQTAAGHPPQQGVLSTLASGLLGRKS